jgi:hemerythrin superfamily protein
MLTASRIAPPFAGRAIGSLRSMTGTDAFEALAQDHRKVLALLDRLAETNNAAAMRRSAMLFQVKRMLTAHGLAEEDIIYPMLHDDAHRAEETKKLYREHADIKVRLFKLEHKAKDDPSWNRGGSRPSSDRCRARA